MTLAQSQLADQRAEVASLGDQVAALEGQLVSLRSQHAFARQTLHEYVYPVLDLPREVSSEIFLQTVVDVFAQREAGLRKRNRLQLFPLSLAHVCRSWRDIALSTPALWSSVALACYNIWAPVKMLERWLARSGALPLDLYLDTGDRAMADEILPVILPYATRWRRLHFFASWGNQDLFVLDPTMFSHAPAMLEELEMRDFSIAGLDSAVTTIDRPFKDATNLRRLTMNVVTLVSLALPFTHLTELTMTGPATPFGVLRILTAVTANLESLNLRLGSSPQGTAYSGSVTLPRLRKLSCASKYAVPALDILTLPALEDLSLGITGGVNSDTRVLALLDRSECALRSLRLDSSAVVTAHALFQAAPTRTVQHLTLVRPRWFDDQRLLIPPHFRPPPGIETISRISSGEWLPELQKLTLEMYLPGEPLMPFVRTVKERSRSRKAIGEFEVTMDDAYNKEALKAIDGLKGVRVSVKAMDRES
ncbi:F-box domain-containing protein [Mycena kentingensis (nom. inval.)]|nr:F-box domain-containing protein [Mycena kentingensis (nom. inval.)]